MTLRVLGLALIEKSSDTGALTASEMVVAWLAEAPDPKSARLNFRQQIKAAAVLVNVQLPPSGTAVGFIVAVAPAGSPPVLTLSLRDALPISAVLMVLVAP